MNAIGVFAAAGFLIGCIGAVVIFVRFHPHTKPVGNGDRTWDRNNPHAQRLFFLFVGFCAFGVLSGIEGFQFGGWPLDEPINPWALALATLMPALALAWVAIGLWRLRKR